MSFVFDQIDAVEREQSDKDQTLQRIRAWRQSKNAKKQKLESESESEPNCNADPISTVPSSTESKLVVESNPNPNPNPDEPVAVKDRSQVELVHPWPEWIELIERLVQQKYFDFLKNEEEDETTQESVLDVSGAAGDEELDFTRDLRTVLSACVNFGKDRFDILRSLSRQDIQILVGYGCPSADKKVAFSAKLLRKHTHLDEGDVCSSCSLRSSCARAFLIPNKEDEARTIDVMRVLLTFAFDPINGSVVNKSLAKQKSVKSVVRKLLHQIVKLSAVPIDPNLPPPVIKKRPPKVKQPPTPPKRRVGRDDIEMKRGDWLCSKCDFMNFAKNTVCLQCDAKRPKRQLLPGEWECPQCNFLNYRRNVVCFQCECKRPSDTYRESSMQEKEFGPGTKFEKFDSRPEVSNAWNFDFDDDESDGADVAAFEYADSSVRRENSPSDGQGRERKHTEFESDPDKFSRVSKVHEREYSDHDSNRPGMGFDDFGDFDDIENYELETPDNPSQKVSSNDLPEVNGYSESEDAEGSDNNMLAHTRISSQSYRKPSKPVRQKYALSGSESDDFDFHSNEKLPVHPNWKSSHVADSRQSRGPMGSSRGLSFGLDEEFGPGSDVDDLSGNFRSRRSKGNRKGRQDISSRRNSNEEDGSFSGSECDDIDLCTRVNRLGGKRVKSNRRGNFRDSESDDDDDLPSHRNRSRGAKVESSGRGNIKGRSNSNFPRGSGIRSGGFKEDFDRSPRGSRNYKDSESDDDDDDIPSHRNRSRGGSVESSRRGNFEGRRNYNFTRDSEFGPNGFSEDFDRSSRGSRSNDRRFQKDNNNGRRMNTRGTNSSKSRGSGRGGFRKRQSGRFNERNDNNMNDDFGEFKNSRRVIER